MHVLDTLQFVESFHSCKELLRIKHEAFAKEFAERVKTLNEILSSTDDINVIQKADSNLKFYRTAAELYDQQNQFIEYFTRSFEQIDKDYWQGVIHYQKLITENQFLKAEVENLQRQRDISVSGWRGERNKWWKDRLQLGRKHG